MSVITVAILTNGCSSTPSSSTPLSYETQMKQAETALRENRVFEAKKRVSQVLQTKPQEKRAQALMARIIERELIREKALTPLPVSDEPQTSEKAQNIRTWLERSRGFLEINQFEEALWCAEQIFLLDPENREASRLVDQIKQKAQSQGRDEELFLGELYKQEISTRIQQYLRQAETSIREKKWATVRFAIEKVLILDPQNAKAKSLLGVLNEGKKEV